MKKNDEIICSASEPNVIRINGKPHPQRYYDRNQEIVDMADKVIAFQNNPHRSGTQSTINRAKKRGINVIVITKEDEKNE